jgi:hypothetical protein
MKTSTVAIALAAALIAPQALAQGSDELWEVKSQMQMAGLPPGMGSNTQKVCREKDPKKEIERQQGKEGCKVTNWKDSGNKVTASITCPEVTGTMEYTYNAARTEYTGTMRMKTKDGDMTMTSQGRRIGACDAAKANQERDAKMAAQKAQGEKMRAQVAQAQAGAMASMKQSQERQIQDCAAAVKTMDINKLGNYAACGNPMPDGCKQMLASEYTKAAATACIANRAEYCKRFQTMDGFTLAEGNANAAELCGVDAERIKTSNCPQAAKTEHLGFLGRFCPKEAKPIAEKHCAGRDFTSARGDKYGAFCSHYLAQQDLDDARRQMNAKPAEKKPASTSEAVTQGVNKGIDKIKGLFGR